MDHYFRAHHMWVRPVLPEPPSFYFRRNCAATFIEQPEILPLMMELDFEDNILIAAAVTSALDAIVTRNSGDFSHSPIPVWDPGELLKRLPAGSSTPGRA